MNQTQWVTVGDHDELVDPDEIERSSRVEKIRSLIERILSESGYPVGEDDLLDQDKDRAVRENLVELFEEWLAKIPLHLGLARYLLRPAVRLRTAALNETVFKNLTRFRSVCHDATLYFDIRVLKETTTQRGKEIVAFLKSSDFS